MMLAGMSALILALVLLGVLARIYADAGLRVFYWPRLEHGYELQHAARLASMPWYLLIYLAAVNGLAILLFAVDLGGRPSDAYGFWFAAMLLPILMVHLLDYRHSRLAALLTMLLVMAAAAGLLYLTGSLVPLLLTAPMLLWSFNGVRATIAARAG
jgi:hypothetical protein